MDINSYLRYTPEHLRQKGLSYYQQGLVVYVDYDEPHQTFDAKVMGNLLYDTKITFENKKVKTLDCSCPVSGLCKHQIAVLYHIKHNLYVYDLFREPPVKPKNLEKTINLNNIYDETYKFHQNKITLKDVVAFADHYRFKKQLIINLYEFHLAVYELFLKLKPNIHLSYLKLYITTYLEVYLNKSSNLNPIRSVLKQMTDDDIKTIYYEAIILNQHGFVFTYANDYKLIVDVILKTVKKYDRLDVLLTITNDKLFNALTKYVHLNKEATQPLNEVLEYIAKPTQKNFSQLLNRLSLKDCISLFNFKNVEINTLTDALFYKETINQHIKYIDFDLTYEQILESIERIKLLDRDNFIKYIERDMYNFGKHRLFTLEKSYKILKLLDYPFDYEHNEMHFYYGLNAGDIKHPHAVLLHHKGLPSVVNKRYEDKFDVLYRAKQHDYEGVLFLDEHTFKEKLVVFDFKHSRYPVASYILEGKKVTPEKSTRYYHNMHEIYGFIKTKSNETIDKRYDVVYASLLEKRSKHLEAQKQKETLKLVGELSDMLQDDIIVQVRQKVDIDIILSFENKHFYKNMHTVLNDTVCGIKVGVNHKYFVKSLEQFLGAVEYGQTIQYGVKLAFNHHIDAFSNRAKTYIDILNTSRGFEYYKHHIGGMLSQVSTHKLFKALRGQTFMVQGVDQHSGYHTINLLDTDYEVIVHISKDKYRINLMDELHGNTYLLIYKGFDIMIDLSSKHARFISYKSDKQRKLVHFLLKNEQIDVGYALPELMKKVLPLVYTDIVLDEDIKLQLKANRLIIHSYFDYDELIDQITIIPKLFRDDIEIHQNKLDENDLEYKKYLNVLNSFGFNDLLMKNQLDILTFFNADLTVFKAFGDVYISDNIQSKQVVKNIAPKIHVSLVENMIKTHVAAANLDAKALKKIIEAYRLGKRYVLLKDKVILTQTDEIKNLNLYLEQNEISLTQIEHHEKPIYEVFKLDHTLDNVKVTIEDKLKTIIKDVSNYKNFEITNKPSMYSLLKNYQIEGFKWLKVLAKHNLGGILADDMGLGKTLQMISFLESEDFTLSMVVCPKSLIYNWAHELGKFNASIKPVIYSGNKEQRDTIIASLNEVNEKTLVIVSYDTVRSDIDQFLNLDIHTIILDEAQHIKTSTAKKTKAVKKLKAKNKFILTGTPVENSIFDLWSMFDFIMPGYLYSAPKFKKLGNKVHENDAQTMTFLIKKTSPFILRRTKGEVLKQLPAKIEEIMYATFDGIHKDAYDAYLKKVKDKLENDDVSKIDLLADLTRLRQLCISPKLIYDNYHEEHIKLDVVYNLIKEATESNHKVLVFSSFVKALDLLKTYLKPENYYMLTGDTPALKRMEMADAFNQSSSVQNVFLISLKAGGTGLNLTGADVVIHLDPWWNLAAENQASDRAHRIGQKRSVTVYKVVMKDSIEEKIILLQNRKRDLFEQMIEYNMDIEKLSDEDYEFILS